MGNNDNDRVSIDLSRIRQAREIQSQNSSLSNSSQTLYSHNGNGLSIQSGTLLREVFEEYGEL